MRLPFRGGRYLDGVVVVFLFAAFVFLPPFLNFWANPGTAWYVPYVAWLGVIVLIALVQLSRDRSEL